VPDVPATLRPPLHALRVLPRRRRGAEGRVATRTGAAPEKGQDMTPKEALDELLERVDDLCNWLDYEFKCEPAVETEIKRLNGARIRYMAAIERERRANLVQNVYEVTAAGFDGSTDATDDRVYWVTAPDVLTVLDAIKDTDAQYTGRLDCPVDKSAVDFDLPRLKIAFSEKLLEWASVERNKNRAY
jgi:hypothetical protein